MRLAFLILCFEVCVHQSFGVPLSNGRSNDVSSNRRYVKPIRVDLFGTEEASMPSSGDEHLTRSNAHDSMNLIDPIQSTVGDLCTTATQRAKYLNRLKMFNDFVKNTIQFLGEASSVVEENLDFEAGQLDTYLEIENIECPETKNITKELMYSDDEDVQNQGNPGDSERSNEITCSLNFNKTLSFDISSDETGPIRMKIDMELKTLPLVQNENSNVVSVKDESEGNHNIIEADNDVDGMTLTHRKVNNNDVLNVLSTAIHPDSESPKVTQNPVYNNLIIPTVSEMYLYEDEPYLRSISGKMAPDITENSYSTSKDTTNDTVTTSITYTLEDEIIHMAPAITENSHSTRKDTTNVTVTTSLTYALEDEIPTMVPDNTENLHTTMQDTSDHIATTPLPYSTDDIRTKNITKHSALQEIKEENDVHDAENSNSQRVILMPDDNQNMEERKCKSTVRHVQDDWCITNCARGFCPPGYCKCA